MWPLIIIQWLHVFFGILWFGSTLYVDFILIPALTSLPLDQQRAASKPISSMSARLIIPAAVVVIVLGILRGTVWGPVQSTDILFGSAYGITFLIAFIAAIATFLWGLLISHVAGPDNEFQALRRLTLNARDHAPFLVGGRHTFLDEMFRQGAGRSDPLQE